MPIATKNSFEKILLQTLGLGALVMMCSSIVAQEVNTTNGIDSKKDETEVINVVGSRVSGRTAVESTVPVDIFDASDLEQTPTLDLKDALQAASPSFTVTRRPSGDGDTFNRPSRLRGLDATEVLVLVNGKRVHRSAILVNRAQAVDLGMYTTSSMKNLQVLRDGASAQYGSDAIAGVINLVLKDEEGVNVEAGWGQFGEGDGTNFYTAINAGFNLNDNGFFNFTIKKSHADPTDRSEPHVTAQFHRDNNYPGADQTIVHQPWGISEADRLNVVWNSAYNVNEDTEMYLFGNYTRSTVNQNFNYRAALPSGVQDELGNRASGTLNNQTGLVPWDPSGAAHFDNTVHLPVGSEYLEGWSPRDVYPGGFMPWFIYNGHDLGVFLGVRGELDNGLTWDVSGSYGRNLVEYDLTNSINPSLGVPQGADGLANNSQAITSFDIGSLINTETSIQADFTYDLNLPNVEFSNLAFGIEYREDNYQTIAGEPSSYEVGPLSDLSVGSNGFQGFSPASALDASRHNISAYVDIDSDITEALNLGFAARFEDFSDFGSDFNWKVSGRYEFSEMIALRGAVSTGFHAPSIAQVNSVQVRTNFDAGVSTFSGLFPAYHPMSQLLGAEELKPEESTSYSLGVVLTPSNNTLLTIDTFRINLDDRIERSQNHSKANYPDQYQALIDSGFIGASSLNSVRFLTNAFDTQTQGVEVVATHDLTWDNADINLMLSYAYIEQEVTRAADTQSDRTVFNIENATTPHKLTASGTYKVGDLAVTTRARYFSTRETDRGFTNDDGSAFIDENPGRVYFDLNVDYDFNDNYHFRAGVNNLFNTYPEDKSMSGDFSSRSMITRGRKYLDSIPWQGSEYYARVTYNF
jgi:iron complex outermembrane receptor protein